MATEARDVELEPIDADVDALAAQGAEALEAALRRTLTALARLSAGGDPHARQLATVALADVRDLAQTPAEASAATDSADAFVALTLRQQLDQAPWPAEPPDPDPDLSTEETR
jgi:hypothetical protein